MPFRLTTVATFRTPTSAWIARNYLATQGIRAHVFDEHIATAIWTWGNAIGWTKLQVETESEQAAHQALLRWREARDLLLSECGNEPETTPQGRPLPPPCMDRQPVTAAERWQPKLNPKEDLVVRAKLAAICAIILLGSPLGLRLEKLTPLYSILAALGLMVYSTRLLMTASKSHEQLRPTYQAELYWGKFWNGMAYSMVVLAIIYALTLGF